HYQWSRSRYNRRRSGAFEGEKNPEQEKLLNHPKVIFTGHNAYHTKEAIDRIQQTSIRNIKSFINGNPINLV
ncbi:MAG: hydroxyacid dehydrogenase, partial [Thermales bacterium]|nr:hydroxyacid dehydrogenase [Thermales bacterium]